MTTSNKPPLGLTPRHFWLRKRVIDCIDALQRLQEVEDWDAYKYSVLSLAKELNYAVTEWELYYNDYQ